MASPRAVCCPLWFQPAGRDPPGSCGLSLLWLSSCVLCVLECGFVCLCLQTRGQITPNRKLSRVVLRLRVSQWGGIGVSFGVGNPSARRLPGSLGPEQQFRVLRRDVITCHPRSNDAVVQEVRSARAWRQGRWSHRGLRGQRRAYGLGDPENGRGPCEF